MTNFPNSPLSPDKTSIIIEKLALKWDLIRIKEYCQQLFEEKIAGESIVKIRALFKEKIKEQELLELKDISRRALSHPAIRLDYIEMGLNHALKPRPVRSVKVGENEYDVTYDIDHQAVKNYLDLAQKEEYSAKRLLVDILKNDVDSPQQSSFEPVEIKVADGFRLSG